MASVQKTQKFDYETVYEIFKEFGPDIRKQINTRNIIPAMRKRLSDADLQPMECLCKNEGPIRAADDLMEAVKRKPKSFVHFIYTVYIEGHSDIVDKIRDYLWKRHTTLLTYLDEKLKKKGLKINSKNVMVVEPLGPQTPCDTPLSVLPPVLGHPLQPNNGQGLPQLGQEPVAIGTVRQQPVHSPIVQSKEVPKLPVDVQPNLIHLPGTTNVHHSADIVLTEIPYDLFSKLSEELHGRDPSNWMKLARAFPYLKRIDVKNIEKEKNPGEALLDMLGEKGCKVHELAKALESARLQNELDILQEHYEEVPKLPVDVRPNLIHLPVTTNVHHSADIVLTEIPYDLFSKLSEELHGRDPSNWMKLARAFPYLKRIDVKNIEKEKNPGEALLDMLGEKGCKVHELAKALESVGLQNELDILQEHYGIFVGGQQGYVSSANIQEPVISQQQQELHAVLNQSQSTSSTGQSSSEQSQNMVYKQNLERMDENNLNMAIEQSIKREVGTKNLNIPGDAETVINNALDTLNICNSQTPIFSQAVPEPQQEPSADPQVSLDNNAEEMLVGANQRAQRMLNTPSERQSNKNVTDNNSTEAEDDPLGKSALHNADIDRLHLIQEVHQQDHQQDQPDPSLSGSFKDIHNHPGHVTMQMDSQLRNDAETS